MSESVETKQSSIRVPESLKGDLEELAYAKSGPDRKVRVSEVIRAAARDYIEKHEENLRVCDPESRGGLGGGSSTRVATKFEVVEYDELKRVAYELSEPGNEVSVAEVLRAALRDYIEKHEDGVREVHPSENGGIASPFR